MLSLRNVKVNRGDFSLKVDELEIREGETIALMGVSGSGKTTLLEVLSGLQDISEGEAETASDMAYGYQNPYLQFFTEKVSSEILFGKPKMDGRIADSYVTRALDDFLLPSSCRDRSPYELSGGEARRLLLATISLDEKPYLFLDECLSGLDEKGEMALRNLIERRRKACLATVFTSHDPEFAAMSDRLLILKDGELCYDGSTRDILSSEKNAARYGLTPTYYGSIAEKLGLSGVLRREELVEAIVRMKEEEDEK